MNDVIAGFSPPKPRRPPTGYPPGRPTAAERERRKVAAEAGAIAMTLGTSPTPPDVPLAAPAKRRQVNPFGSMVQKMKRPERPGFHRHWFNDDPGRIEMAQQGGYEHVTKNGAPETHQVGTTKTGGVLIAYLMEIPEEFYREDMAAQQATVDANEAGFKRGTDEQGGPGQDGRYIPSRGIKIQTA